MHMQFGALVILLPLAGVPQMQAQRVSLDPASMPRVGTIDERFASYNIEMAEVTGGTFWKPYGTSSKSTQSNAEAQSASAPAGMNPDMYQYRPPIDLSNARLRKLAAALSPAYVRVSGTWANTVYFADSGNPPAKAPAGFSSVLTQRQWKGVLDFVRAVNGELVTSFATGAGTRNSQGVWTPKEADRWLAYTKSAGGHIAAAEFMNEPTYAVMGGAPKGYDAAMYGRDIAVFGPWLKQNSPGTVFLGPGSVGEGPFAMEMKGMLPTVDLMEATGPVFDVFDYHLYAAASQRCASKARRARPRQQQLSLLNGSRARRRSMPSTLDFATGSNPGNPSGSPKLRMQPVVEIPGRPRSLIHFVTLFNTPAWRAGASRSSCTTRLPQAIMVCWTQTRSSLALTIGRRCSGAS